jgi:nucleoid-associated protein YgaU
MISTPTSAPKTYTVQRGDYPGLIAQKITGDAGRWLELTRANPSKPVWTSAEIAALKAAKKTVPGSAQAGNFKTLYAGEVLTLPANW